MFAARKAGTRAGRTLQNQLAGLELQTAGLATKTIERLRQEFLAAKDTLAQVVMRQEDLNFQLGAAEQEVETCRQALMSVVSQAAELRNQLVQADESGLALERQTSRVESEKARIQEEHSRLSAELEAYISSNQSAMRARLRIFAESVSQTTSDLDQARSQEISLRSKLEELRREFSGSTARKESLEQSLARHAYSTESVQEAALRRNFRSSVPAHPACSRISSKSHPDTKRVVEEFLRQELECVVVSQYDQARSGISLLKTQGTGRSTFFVTNLPSGSHVNGRDESPIRREPGVVAAIRDLVKFEPKLGLNGDLVLPAISSAYAVDTEEAAERLASAYPDCHFLTPTGAHYHHRMVTGGKGASAGPLALRRDFRELERRTAELESQIRSNQAALEEANERARQLDEQLKSLVGRRQEAEKRAVVADEKLRQVREGSDRTRRQLDALSSEAATLQSERARTEERQALLRAEIEDLRPRREATASKRFNRPRNLQGIPRGPRQAGAG